VAATGYQHPLQQLALRDLAVPTDSRSTAAFGPLAAGGSPRICPRLANRGRLQPPEAATLWEE
jgi:hypothetical protein